MSWVIKKKKKGKKNNVARYTIPVSGLTYLKRVNEFEKWWYYFYAIKMYY